ncbi:MAG: lytic transglycosylase domain-containing protein [Candidatus Parabeggiatoa sp.]|nr:lytic transglycosylase domain-containing protein [Candidatus Parabeggiatoa sp.]
MKRFLILLALMTSCFIVTCFHISNSYARGYAHSELRQLAREAASRYEVDVGLIFALIQQESGWQDQVVSHAGARGVMQIMPATGQSACRLKKKQLFDAAKNIDCGVRYFSKQLNRFQSEKLALCAYNAGPGRAKKGLTRCNRITETRKYMRNIMAIWGGGKKYEAVPEEFVSAKAIADNWFIYGDDYILPSQWWRLVCRAVDEVYYKKSGKKGAAITPEDKAVWHRVLTATVDDIYADTKRVGQEKSWPSNRIKSKIKSSCSKTNNTPELSAKKIADQLFNKGADQSPKMWWKWVCEAIEVVYHKEKGSHPFAMSTSDNAFRNKILETTVDEIYADEVKHKGNKAWARDKIRRKIKRVCR